MMLFDPGGQFSHELLLEQPRVVDLFLRRGMQALRLFSGKAEFEEQIGAGLVT
jgi:hypothetical protein